MIAALLSLSLVRAHRRRPAAAIVAWTVAILVSYAGAGRRGDRSGDHLPPLTGWRKARRLAA